MGKRLHFWGEMPPWRYAAVAGAVVAGAGLLGWAWAAFGGLGHGPAAVPPPLEPPPRAAASAAVAARGPSLAAWCERVAAQVKGLEAPRCRDSGLQAGDGLSVQGVPLWWRDVPPAVASAPRDGGTLRVLVLGGIHGDEQASVALVFDWLQRAVADPTNRTQWRMVPLLNPDGVFNQPAARRINARGVDLNRNFPTPDWSRDALVYWAQRTKSDPRRYPGPGASSEPETRWTLAQIERFKPHLIVSVHAPYGVLDFDGPPPPPKKVGSLILNQVGIYPGSLGNYGASVLRIPVVTLELRNATRVKPEELGTMWADLRRWIDQRAAVLAGADGAAAAPQTALQAAASPASAALR